MLQLVRSAQRQTTMFNHYLMLQSKGQSVKIAGCNY